MPCLWPAFDEHLYFGGLHDLHSSDDFTPRPANSNCVVGRADKFSPLQLSDNIDVSFCFPNAIHMRTQAFLRPSNIGLQLMPGSKPVIKIAIQLAVQLAPVWQTRPGEVSHSQCSNLVVHSTACMQADMDLLPSPVPEARQISRSSRQGTSFDARRASLAIAQNFDMAVAGEQSRWAHETMQGPQSQRGCAGSRKKWSKCSFQSSQALFPCFSAL